jgi:hypothetical protein
MTSTAAIINVAFLIKLFQAKELGSIGVDIHHTTAMKFFSS